MEVLRIISSYLHVSHGTFQTEDILSHPSAACKLKALEGCEIVDKLCPSVAYIVSKHAERQTLVPRS